MGADAGSTHDFLTLDGEDEKPAAGQSMFDKPDVQPGHREPAVPPRQKTAAAKPSGAGPAVAATAAGAVAAGGAAMARAGSAPGDQASANQQAYAKLKADRAKARQQRRRKKKADPLEAELTNIEKEQDDINKKYAEGSGSGMAVLLIACFVLLAVCGVLFYIHGDQIIETFKTTPWFRYIWIVVAMYSYANSKY